MENYWIFLTASFLLWITPGQDTIYIITRSISQGRSAGFASALGIGTGSIVHAALSIAGVSVIILTSPLLFLLVKMLGGLYLIYLGLSALRSKVKTKNLETLRSEPLSRIYSQGVLTNILNPKVALFFIAFLPQFVGEDAPVADLFILGLSFVIGGTMWCLVLAYFASTVAKMLGQSSRIKAWFNKLSGVVYITLGLNVLRIKA